MEEFEDRLIEIISVGKEEFEVRLGALEDSLKALRKHWKNMDRMNSISRGNEQAIQTVFREEQASHNSRLVCLESQDYIADFLIAEVANLKK